ncbi:PQQ-binding-like beta-propeller repeat protein [Gracilimonas mengyeensis]|uniref:Outer membrane protein assembly factor BamB, contains PQQ-like beta-propeller repeat n=1 Tax=Gracilimonas mengyeensis TaxID=1302730 RepID=A0A521BWS1_9BACT|nr:PQQ-binding-like beta-propeller repeat protein [Gracilimonas mengyeensis]SMO51596.1 Outer membrane protein assembly factor BamB, contains PQQ-like beta-propeller repeat [Gracilimonas mengyeensis]
MRYLLTILFFIPITLSAQQATQSAEWKFKSDGKIIGSAAIEDGKVYVGTTAGSLYALDIESGDTIWKFNTNGRWASKPLIGGKLLYQLNGNGIFYAIDKTNGEVRWTFSTGGEHRMERGTGSSTYVDIWDYYLSGASQDGNTIYFGSSDGHVYALNATDGTLKWKYATSGEVHATPVIGDSLVYAGSMDGKLYALRKTNGTLAWEFDTIGARYFPKGAVQRAPVLTEDALIFGSRDYNLYALNPANGKGLWNFRDPGGWIIATPAVKNGGVFVGTSDSHLFYRFDAQSGRKEWEIPLNMRVYGSAVFDDDRVYFGCFNGYLYGVNRENGSVEWSFQTDGSKANYHTVYDDEDEFRDDFVIYGNTLEATIQSEEQIQDMGSILSTPVIEEGVIYFGSTDSMFYAVKLLH